MNSTKFSDLSLIFTWGGFVFLSINFIIGASFASVEFINFLFANIFAFVLFAITMFAPVYISVKEKLNFSQALQKYIPNNFVNIFFIFMVVVINTGWYSIQIEVIRNLLNIENFIILVVLSYVFALGAYLFGYRWLKKFSFIVLSIFIIYIVFFLIKHEDNFNLTLDGSVNIKEIQSIGFMIYGTWAFSSSSIIMDITKQAKNFKVGYTSVLIGMFIGNFLLLFLGYILAKNSGINNFTDFVALFGSFLGMLLLVLNIWTTNDSNFYSSMVALKQIGVSKKVSFMLLPFISASLVMVFQDNLFTIIGEWLVFMGYIGIMFTILWWYIIINKYFNYSLYNNSKG